MLEMRRGKGLREFAEYSTNKADKYARTYWDQTPVQSASQEVHLA